MNSFIAKRPNNIFGIVGRRVVGNNQIEVLIRLSEYAPIDSDSNAERLYVGIPTVTLTLSILNQCSAPHLYGNPRERTAPMLEIL